MKMKKKRGTGRERGREIIRKQKREGERNVCTWVVKGEGEGGRERQRERRGGRGEREQAITNLVSTL